MISFLDEPLTVTHCQIVVSCLLDLYRTIHSAHELKDSREMGTVGLATYTYHAELFVRSKVSLVFKSNVPVHQSSPLFIHSLPYNHASLFFLFLLNI